jgi:hypothetical protein
MDMAAENGHLETLIWLHKNRTEGCSIGAINMATQNKHIKVANWLNENKKM